MTDLDLIDVERPMVDLSVTHFERHLRGIRVTGTWMGRPPEPALILSNPAWQSGRIDNSRTNLCAIRLRDAWIFGERGDPRSAAHYLFQFARNLGLTEFNKVTMFRLLTVVQDSLQDLLMMPPRPPLQRQAVADAILTRADGSTVHREIVDYD